MTTRQARHREYRLRKARDASYHTSSIPNNIDVLRQISPHKKKKSVHFTIIPNQTGISLDV